MSPHDFEGEIIPQNHLFAYLRRDGEPDGSMDLAVDGSIVPAFFEYMSPQSRRSIRSRHSRFPAAIIGAISLCIVM